MQPTCSRRQFLKQTLGAGLALSTGAAAGLLNAAEPKKPNVIFILIDDLGWADLGCYGNPLHETPNVDRLAKEGMRFTQAYTPCAVCSPTRAAIQTGKYPIRMDLTDWIPGARKKNTKLLERYTATQMPLQEQTVAETFRAAGYQTWFLGKWHLGETEEFWPEHQGYDINLGGHSKGSPPGGYFAPYDNPRLKSGPDGEYLTDRLGDEAVNLIARHSNDSKPFLMMMCFYTVHTPIQPKSELKAKYEQKLKALADKRWNNPSYAAMVDSMDQNVGKIIKALKTAGCDDNTIVIFTSDNGGLKLNGITVNDPLRTGKGYYYEGGIRVPTIIRWPGAVRPGSETDCPVISMDFYPTMLQMAGLPLKPDQHTDGLSLTGLLRGGPAPKRDTFYWHYPHYHGSGETPCSAIRSGDYKFIRHYEDNRREVYNIAEDLSERRDLYAQMPEKAKELEAKLNAWLTSMNAYIPTPKP